MKSPIFSKEKLLYFPQKSGIVPIFRKSLSSYISYFCEYTPWAKEILRWWSRQPSRCSRRWSRTWGWWRGCCGCGSGHRAGETWSIWKLFWSSMCSLSHHHYHAHHWSDPPWCIPRLLHHRPSWRWLISGQPDLITIIVIIMAPIKTFVFWWLNIQKW